MNLTDEELEKERAQYRKMVAVIMNNDPGIKKRVDAHARDQVKSIRESMPGVADEIVIMFMLSMATFVARIMSLPFSHVDDAMHSVFDNNMVGAAHVIGAYDLDNPDDLPHWDGKAGSYRFPFGQNGRDGQADDANPAPSGETIDDIIARQYL